MIRKSQNNDRSHPVLSGTALEIYQQGVLITGDSGIGKSDLALQLINNGHILIADDAVSFKHGDSGIIAFAQPSTLGLMSIRGLGIIDIDDNLKQNCVNRQTHLELIIDLQKWNSKQWQSMDQLKCLRSKQQIMGRNIAKYVLPVNQGRPLALLIELYIKHHIHLKTKVNNISMLV